MPNTNKPTVGFHTNPGNINRKGAPKKEWTIKGMIQEALAREDKEGITDKQYVYEKLVELAKSGDMAAQREMNNRLEGMAKQSLDVKGKIEHNVVNSPTKRPLESPPETD